MSKITNEAVELIKNAKTLIDVQQARERYVAMRNGLEAIYRANEPTLPAGYALQDPSEPAGARVVLDERV